MSIKTSFHGASVLVTGHTGFKGSWLCLLLNALGARVTGIALPPPTTPSLFELLNIESKLERSNIIDVRDEKKMRTCIEKIQPDMVFHMASQPLVLESYRDPVGTFSSNIIGTVNVLDALRSVNKPVAAVMITSDKCYKNLESQTPYSEDSHLGGSDPYTASKACAEIVSHAYRSAFFSSGQIAVATARAGNVLGGGDFGANRLVPDLYRCAVNNTPIRLRYPDAIRPWQYVLDVLWGYIMLAAALKEKKEGVTEAFNFAPLDTKPMPVRAIVEHVTRMWERPIPVEYENPLHPETGVLRIDSSKAASVLGWKSQMSAEDMLSETAKWYKEYLSGKDMNDFTQNQIADFIRGAF